MTYTEEEIEAAAMAIEPGAWDDVDVNTAALAMREWSLEIARAALGAVPRVPAGHWIAPDEPDKFMIAAGHGVGRDQEFHPDDGNWISWTEHDPTEVYRAMRDVVKGRKP